MRQSWRIIVLWEKVGIWGGLPWWLSGKESTCQCRRHGFNPWVGQILWRREWQPTPVFLSGKSHGQRSLVSYSPWGRKESDMTERLNNNNRHLGNGVEWAAVSELQSFWPWVSQMGMWCVLGMHFRKKTMRWIDGAGFQSSCWQIMEWEIRQGITHIWRSEEFTWVPQAGMCRRRRLPSQI